MGVLTDFFRATEAELRATYPAWKAPLTAPVRQMLFNPFTRKEEEILTWDPDPKAPVTDAGPPGPPSPSIDLKGIDQTNVSSLMRVVLTDSESEQDAFMRAALIGPEEGPWIHELPASFVSALAGLGGNELERVAAEWTRVERADLESIANEFTRNRMLAERTHAYWRETLTLLADFARAAIAEQRRMYMWISL